MEKPLTDVRTAVKPPVPPKTLIVPLSNPNTAETMLRLALSLVDPDEGKVIALIITLESVEAVSEAQEHLQAIITKLNTIHALNREDAPEGETEPNGDDQRIRLIMRSASSITRGILDATREYGANTLIMGVQRPEMRKVKIGKLVENVIQGAMCDVLIYRPDEASTGKYTRIIVPLDGKRESLTALRSGTLIARTLGIPLIYNLFQGRYYYSEEYQERIDIITSTLPPENVMSDVVMGRDNPARRLLRKVKTSDLIVIGFAQKNEFEREIEESIAKTLLNHADASVMMTSRLIEQEDVFGDFKRFLQRFNLRLTNVERNELIWQARQSVVNNIDYMSMIIFSAALASLGLLLNSVAVIIGAMLVAPLMTPLVALSVGIVTGEFDITRRSLFFLVQGVTLGIIVSVASGYVMPIEIATSEMMARGSPSLLDAGVALVSGWAAAYATARKDIPAALAGVAIAAALMPPLCTIGLGIALGNTALAGGATLLFATNIVFIVGMQAIAFFWFGLTPRERDSQPLWAKLWWGMLGIFVVAIVFQLVALGQRAVDDVAVQRRLAAYFEGSQYITTESYEEDSSLVILVTLRTDRDIRTVDVARAQADLSEWLGRDVELNVAYMPIIRAEVIIDEVPQLFPLSEDGTDDSDDAPSAEATAEAP